MDKENRKKAVREMIRSRRLRQTWYMPVVDSKEKKVSIGRLKGGIESKKIF